MCAHFILLSQSFFSCYHSLILLFYLIYFPIVFSIPFVVPSWLLQFLLSPRTFFVQVSPGCILSSFLFLLWCHHDFGSSFWSKDLSVRVSPGCILSCLFHSGRSTSGFHPEAVFFFFSSEPYTVLYYSFPCFCWV